MWFFTLEVLVVELDDTHVALQIARWNDGLCALYKFAFLVYAI